MGNHAADRKLRDGVFSFDLTEELTLLQSTARDFARDALLPELRSAEAERAVGAAARSAYAQIGLADLELPVDLGGAGYGALARALVNEELAAADAGAALALDRLGPALYAWLELGGTGALRSVLQAPEARALLVTTAEASLRRHSDDLSGCVPYVPADRAQLLVVLASDHALVVRDGLTFERVRGAGLRAAGGAELRLDGARIVARLERSDDPLAASRVLGRARLYIAGLLLGVLRHADDYARAYALEREAFGRKIAHHQALAFLLVDMHTAIDGARLLIHDAALRADLGQPFTAAAASALVETIEVARWVGPAAVQVLGGHGFMQDHPVEKLMREARALGLLLGGIDAARDDACDALNGLALPVQLSAEEGA